MNRQQMIHLIDRELRVAEGRVATLQQAKKAVASLNGARRGGRRNMSIAARQRIGAAQRARWAKWKREQRAA
jgi:hypothetical protein